jgi:hypothetical protein
VAIDYMSLLRIKLIKPVVDLGLVNLASILNFFLFFLVFFCLVPYVDMCL